MYESNYRKDLVLNHRNGCQDIFDASTDVLAWQLNADYADEIDFSEFNGIPNNAGSGVTGDIMFTTVGHSNNDVYTVCLSVIKHYG